VVWSQSLIAFGFACAFWRGVGRLYGPAVAAFAVAILLLGFDLIFLFPFVLLDTTLSVTASAVALYLLLRFGRAPEVRSAVLAGLWLGMASALRNNFLPFAPVAALWVAAKASPPWAARAWAATLFALAFALPLLPIAARNLHVAGRFTIVPATSGMNLWLGNHPPAQTGATYFDPSFAPPPEERVSAALRYIRDEPGRFASRARGKLAYVVGVPRGEAVRVRVLVPHIFALLAFIGLRRVRPWRDELALLSLWIALQWALLAVVFPWGYGWRLSAPTFPAVYVLGALGVWAVASGGLRSGHVPHT
jgi:hypothetical protein